MVADPLVSNVSSVLPLPTARTSNWPLGWGAVAGAIAAALIAFSLVCFAPQVLKDGDTFWHVAAGQWMLDHSQVLRADPFSFTVTGRSWHAHEWLSEIAAALAYNTAGWAGVLILFGVAAGAAFGILAWRIGRRVPPATAMVLLAVVAICLAPSLLARPHLLAAPIIVLWTIALVDARSAGRAPSLLWLPLIALWANLHGSVVLGLGMAPLFALEALLSDRTRWKQVLVSWGTFGLGAVVAALATPRGLDGLLFSIKLIGMKSMASIAEWRAPDFQSFPPIEIALIVAIFGLVSQRVRIPPIRLVLLLILLHMALTHVRHQVPLVLIGAVVIAEAMGEVAKARSKGWPGFKSLAGLLSALAVAVLVVRLALPVTWSDGPATPIQALAHVPPSLRSKPVLSDYDAGGYLIYNGVRPFIDGRTDLYGDDFNARYDAIMAGDQTQLRAALSQYGIAWSLLPRRSLAAKQMDAMPGWRRLYADAVTVVHVRATQP